MLLRSVYGTLRPMNRGKRNAADLKSGNAVSRSAPVLNQPTNPEHLAENQGLAPVQHKSGRGLGQRPIGGAAAVPLPLSRTELRLLTEFFLLLDGWERNLHATESV